jgi:hypothetical protein
MEVHACNLSIRKAKAGSRDGCISVARPCLKKKKNLKNTKHTEECCSRPQQKLLLEAGLSRVNARLYTRKRHPHFLLDGS